MFCEHCGNQISDTAKFCPHCGAKVAAPIPSQGSSQPPSMSGQRLVACTACGSHELRQLSHGVYLCEYCGSRFLVDDDKTITDAEVVDAQVLAAYLKANDYSDKEDYTNELQTLVAVLPLAPNNTVLRNKIGRAYRRLGLNDKALEQYNKAMELDPDNPSSYANIGILNLILDNCSEAKTYLEKALGMIEKNPDSATPGDKATFWGNYAYCVGKMGDKTRAYQLLDKAEKMGYKNGDTMRQLLKQNSSGANTNGQATDAGKDANKKESASGLLGWLILFGAALLWRFNQNTPALIAAIVGVLVLLLGKKK